MRFIIYFCFGFLLCGQALGHSFYKTLETQFYAPVPFKYDHAFCTQAMDTFFDFLTLPEAQKMQFQGKLSETHRRSGLGLTYRKKTKGTDYSDQKCFFHYHPVLWRRHKRVVDQNPTTKRFFTKADALWHEAYARLKCALSQLESRHPGITDQILNTKTPHLVLRFLRYDVRTPGKLLAKPHYDAGAMTFAIAESKPGLRMGSTPQNLTLVTHKDKQALFFLGANFAQLTDTKTLKPGWHDVIQVGARPKNNQYERWAIVAFIDGHSTTGAPEALTHKWRIDPNLL